MNFQQILPIKPPWWVHPSRELLYDRFIKLESSTASSGVAGITSIVENFTCKTRSTDLLIISVYRCTGLYVKENNNFVKSPADILLSQFII